MLRELRAAVVTTLIAMFGGFCTGTVVILNHPGFSFFDAGSRAEWLDTSIITAILFGAALWAPSMRPRDVTKRQRFEDLPEGLQKPIMKPAIFVSPKAGGDEGASQAPGGVPEDSTRNSSLGEQKGEK